MAKRWRLVQFLVSCYASLETAEKASIRRTTKTAFAEIEPQ